MSSSLPALGSLSESAQLKSLKSAKIALWLVGILSIALQTFLFFNAGNEYDKAFNKQLEIQGTPQSALENLDADTKALIDKERTDAISKIHLIYGAGIGLGVIFIICALMVDKKPVIATMTGLVLYLGSIAAMAAIDPTTIAQGIIMKAVIIIVLIKAVKAAIAYERERRLSVA